VRQSVALSAPSLSTTWIAIVRGAFGLAGGIADIGKALCTLANALCAVAKATYGLGRALYKVARNLATLLYYTGVFSLLMLKVFHFLFCGVIFTVRAFASLC
jgi:hypothetical protein